MQFGCASNRLDPVTPSQIMCGSLGFAIRWLGCLGSKGLDYILYIYRKIAIYKVIKEISYIYIYAYICIINSC